MARPFRYHLLAVAVGVSLIGPAWADQNCWSIAQSSVGVVQFKYDQTFQGCTDKTPATNLVFTSDVSDAPTCTGTPWGSLASSVPACKPGGLGTVYNVVLNGKTSGDISFSSNLLNPPHPIHIIDPANQKTITFNSQDQASASFPTQVPVTVSDDQHNVLQVVSLPVGGTATASFDQNQVLAYSSQTYTSCSFSPSDAAVSVACAPFTQVPCDAQSTQASVTAGNASITIPANCSPKGACPGSIMRFSLADGSGISLGIPPWGSMADPVNSRFQKIGDNRYSLLLCDRTASTPGPSVIFGSTLVPTDFSFASPEKVSISLAQTPSDGPPPVRAVVSDLTRSTAVSVAVPWGGQVVALLDADPTDELSVSADPVYGENFQYSFDVTKTSAQYFSLNATPTPIEKGVVQATVGFPDGFSVAPVRLTGLDGPKQSKDFQAGSSNSWTLPVGSYHVSASPLVTEDGKSEYTVKSVDPSALAVQSAQAMPLQISYNTTPTPTVVFSPYADMTLGFDLLSYLVNNKIRSVHLAFVNSQSADTCIPGTGAPPAAALEDNTVLKQLQDNASIPYVIAFGGYCADSSGCGSAPYDFAMVCKDTASLQQAYEDTVATAKPAGLDFDIEGNLVGQFSTYGDKMLTAIKGLQDAHPTLPMSLTLPVAPTGLTTDGLAWVQGAKSKEIDFSVNLMVMDYSSGPCAEPLCMSNFAKQAADATAQQLASVWGISVADAYKKITLTAMIGQNDQAGQIFTLEDVQAMRAYASEQGIPWISLWAANRDTPCSSAGEGLYLCSQPNTQNPVQKNPGDFTRTFLTGVIPPQS